MQDYEVTLTAISSKVVRMSADSAEKAMEKAQNLYFSTNALDFTDEDVQSVTAEARRVLA